MAVGLGVSPVLGPREDVARAAPVTALAAPGLARAMRRSPVLDAVVTVGVSMAYARAPVDRRTNHYPLQEKCRSTVFGSPGDRWAGGSAACLGTPIRPFTIGIAHRSLPCGTPVLIRNPQTGRSIVVPVVDRGPYGAILDDGSWAVKRRATDPGEWRGCADLTPLTALLLGHDGWDTVYLSYERPRRGGPVL